MEMCTKEWLQEEINQLARFIKSNEWVVCVRGKMHERCICDIFFVFVYVIYCWILVEAIWIISYAMIITTSISDIVGFFFPSQLLGGWVATYPSQHMVSMCPSKHRQGDNDGDLPFAVTNTPRGPLWVANNPELTHGDYKGQVFSCPSSAFYMSFSLMCATNFPSSQVES